MNPEENNHNKSTAPNTKATTTKRKTTTATSSSSPSSSSSQATITTNTKMSTKPEVRNYFKNISNTLGKNNNNTKNTKIPPDPRGQSKMSLPTTRITKTDGLRLCLPKSCLTCSQTNLIVQNLAKANFRVVTECTCSPPDAATTTTTTTTTTT